MPVLQANLQDESHLHMLSVFHYVLGGLCVLGLGFIIMHFAVMSFAFGMASKTSSASIPATPPAAIEAPGEMEIQTDAVLETEEPAIEPVTVAPTPASAPAHSPGIPKEIMTMMIGFYVVFGLIACAMATANFMSARYIKKRKNKTFSIVVAAINCLQMPFGTVLGVFTIIVLMRPSVQSSYEAGKAA